MDHHPAARWFLAAQMACSAALLLSVFVGWCKLVFDVFLFKPLLEFLQAFIIQLVELWFAATGCYCAMDVHDGLIELECCPIFDGA